MTIAEQMKALKAALKAWAAAAGSNVEVSSDAVHFVDLLRVAPGGLRVAILFDTETPRGEHDELGRVDRQFLVGIGRGRGLNLEIGDSLIYGTAGGKPLFDLAEEAREILRAVQFEPETCEKIEYLGIDRLNVPGPLLDAYTVRVGVGVQIPEQFDQPEE